MIPTTTGRVTRHTDPSINTEIRRRSERDIALAAARGSGAISRRLRDLDREWDMERTLEANAATIALLGLGLGALVDRRFFVIPAIVSGFLLQHAVQGWCPPLPIFRRMGVRTQREIEEERFALKALRGDFENAPQKRDPSTRVPVRETMEAVRK